MRVACLETGLLLSRATTHCSRRPLPPQAASAGVATTHAVVAGSDETASLHRRASLLLCGLLRGMLAAGPGGCPATEAVCSGPTRPSRCPSTRRPGAGSGKPGRASGRQRYGKPAPPVRPPWTGICRTTAPNRKSAWKARLPAGLKTRRGQFAVGRCVEEMSRQPGGSGSVPSPTPCRFLGRVTSLGLAGTRPGAGALERATCFHGGFAAARKGNG